MTRECISVTFDPRGTLSFLKIGFSSLNAAVARTILEIIPGVGLLYEATAPWYLKLVTVPSFCHFTFISTWMSLVLFVISMLFLPLISFSYLVQVSSVAYVCSIVVCVGVIVQKLRHF